MTASQLSHLNATGEVHMVEVGDRPTPAHPLLLVVHGRSGGELPEELVSLAAELEHRRGAPVRLQALSAVAPPEPQQLALGNQLLTLVPLLLLPGGHVRRDLPAI
ncbi:MAG: hypothetical protein O2787_05525, partial [Cyanobacteria bacterium]|nr:hypothetical protein [Cyanobacteriota bacterium]